MTAKIFPMLSTAFLINASQTCLTNITHMFSHEIINWQWLIFNNDLSGNSLYIMFYVFDKWHVSELTSNTLGEH